MLTSAPRRFCAPSFLRPVVSAPRRFCAPSFLRLSVFSLCLLLATLSAHAGSYIGVNQVAVPGSNPVTYTLIPYSGGTCTVPGPNGTPTTPADTLGSQGYGGASGGITASCAGPITASWTWTPAKNMTMTTDPPPTSVIVTESCTASVTVVSPAVIGTYDTGMGKGGSVSWKPGGSNTAGATVTRYSAHAGGATVTLPAVSASASAASPGDTCSVYYTASISPVIITPSGCNPAYQALTGQQIMGTLSGIPSAVKITSYTWSFSGGTKGNPIKNWDGNGVAVDGTTPQQLFSFLNADLSQTDTTGNGISVNPISFYDQAADTITTKCAISLTFPDGTTGSINPASVPVTFMKPAANWTVNSTAPFGPQFDPSATGSMSFAVLWDATITVPSPFSGGSGCFAQIVQPTIQFQRHPLNNQPVNCYLQEPRTNTNGTTSYALPTTGLDTHFPYQASSTQIYPGGYIWDVSTKGEAGDQPGVGFGIAASDNGGNNWYTAFASGSFTTWLMYRPPASATGPGGTIWVPLQRVDWSWTGNVVKNTATGMWNSASNGNTAVTGSSSSAGLVTDTPPQWSVINAGTAALRP